MCSHQYMFESDGIILCCDNASFPVSSIHYYDPETGHCYNVPQMPHKGLCWRRDTLVFNNESTGPTQYGAEQQWILQLKHRTLEIKMRGWGGGRNSVTFISYQHSRTIFISWLKMEFGERCLNINLVDVCKIKNTRGTWLDETSMKYLSLNCSYHNLEEAQGQQSSTLECCHRTRSCVVFWITLSVTQDGCDDSALFGLVTFAVSHKTPASASRLLPGKKRWTDGGLAQHWSLPTHFLLNIFLQIKYRKQKMCDTDQPHDEWMIPIPQAW